MKIKKYDCSFCFYYSKPYDRCYHPSGAWVPDVVSGIPDSWANRCSGFKKDPDKNRRRKLHIRYHLYNIDLKSWWEDILYRISNKWDDFKDWLELHERITRFLGKRDYYLESNRDALTHLYKRNYMERSTTYIYRKVRGLKVYKIVSKPQKCGK